MSLCYVAYSVMCLIKSAINFLLDGRGELFLRNLELFDFELCAAGIIAH